MNNTSNSPLRPWAKSNQAGQRLSESVTKDFTLRAVAALFAYLGQSMHRSKDECLDLSQKKKDREEGSCRRQSPKS
jgi:hypothetical protein